MKTNYSMVLKQLQMAYMVYTMKDVKEEEQCVLCWENKCGCDSNSVKNDPFINLSAEELYGI